MDWIGRGCTLTMLRGRRRRRRRCDVLNHLCIRLPGEPSTQTTSSSCALPSTRCANGLGFNVAERTASRTFITDVVVDAIIEVAATGERDPERLCEGVLARLKAPDRDVA
jgi:hypothetical protein